MTARTILLALALVAQPAAAQTVAALAGMYDGGQPEIAAGLELRADGRFRYGLSYGGLDERAEGQWRIVDGQVQLTSDPVTPPRFVLVAQRDLPGGQYRIVLDVPQGMSRRYFDASFRFADGAGEERQLTDEQASFALKRSGARAVSVSLPMFDVRSAAVPLNGKDGEELQFRFEPNDLGKVAFAATPLRIERGVLVLTRYDRTLRFKRED
jgi:hypothetical protein